MTHRAPSIFYRAPVPPRFTVHSLIVIESGAFVLMALAFLWLN